jgi:hypothetical protein
VNRAVCISTVEDCCVRVLQPVKGLVRAGRSLEQYDVTRGEEDKPVIRTTFADRPVVLKVS